MLLAWEIILKNIIFSMLLLICAIAYAYVEPTPVEIVSGSVNVIGSVSSSVTGTVGATVLNPVTSVTVTAMPPISGNVIVDSGAVTVLNPVTSVTVSNFPALQQVSGSVNVDNFPTPLGTLAISNFPALQQVSGSVESLQSGVWNVGIIGTVNSDGTVVVSSGAVTVLNPVTSLSITSLPPIYGTTARSWTLSAATDSILISGSIDIPPPVGGATEAKQDTTLVVLGSINSALAGTLATLPPTKYYTQTWPSATTGTLLVNVEQYNTMTFEMYDPDSTPQPAPPAGMLYEQPDQETSWFSSIDGVHYNALSCSDSVLLDGQLPINSDPVVLPASGKFKCDISGLKYVMFITDAAGSSTTRTRINISLSSGTSVLQQVQATGFNTIVENYADLATATAQTAGNTSLANILLDTTALRGSMGVETSNSTAIRGSLGLVIADTTGIRGSLGLSVADTTAIRGSLATINSTTASLQGSLATGNTNTANIFADTTEIRGSLGTTNSVLNTISTTDSNILTSVQLIDDGIATAGSAITTKGMAAVGTDGTSARVLKTNGSGELQVGITSYPATYFYSNSNTTFTPAATPNHMLTITGSATKTVKVRSLIICATATAAGHAKFYLAKHSAATTGGTSATITATPLDSSNAAATATVRQYSVDPTPGALVGTRLSRWMYYGITAGTTIENACVDMIRGHGEDYADNALQPFVLRGTSEVLAFDKNDEALPAGFAIQSYRIVTTEE